jgi:hypothetical protein
MSGIEDSLPVLSPQQEALMPDKCRECWLGRKMMQLSGYSTDKNLIKRLEETAERIDELCTGYKKLREDEFIVSGANSMGHALRMFNNPACPFSQALSESDWDK